MPPASFIIIAHRLSFIISVHSFPNPEGLHVYRNAQGETTYDPIRGQIITSLNVFYKHVMPPASFCCSSMYRIAASSFCSMAIFTARLAVS